VPHARRILAHEGLESRGLGELLASADVPNIQVKVAGLHYCTDRGWNHSLPDVLAAFERIREAYGPERLYWGSDFPGVEAFHDLPSGARGRALGTARSSARRISA